MSCNFVFNETRDTVGRVAEKCTQGVRDNSAGGGGVIFNLHINMNLWSFYAREFR